MSAPRTGVQAKKFSAICRIVCADPGVDLFIIQGQLPFTAEEPYSPEPFLDVMAATDKPVIAYGRTAQNVTDAGRAFQSEGRRALHPGPARDRARGAATSCATARRSPPASRRCRRSAADAGDLGGARVGDSCSTRTDCRSRAARARETPHEAAAAAAAIGFPGGGEDPVAAGAAQDRSGRRGTWSRRRRRASPRRPRRWRAASRRIIPARRSTGFLVQEMVDGLEMIVGVREDPLYGPVMVAGLGGVLVEALNDVAIRLLPVDEAMAAEMLRRARRREASGRRSAAGRRAMLRRSRVRWRGCREFSSTIARF